MAPSENVEIVRRVYQTVESGDLAASAALLHEGFEMAQLPGWPEAAICRGGEEALRAMTAWASSFDDFRGVPEQFTAVGDDHVVVAYHEWGRPRDGTVEIEHLYGILYTLREGKIARMEWFASPQDALQAAEPSNS